MSKQIKVSDEIYDRLKKAADDSFRPMGSQIEYLLAVDEHMEIKAYEEKADDWAKQQSNLPDAMQDETYKRMVSKTPQKSDQSQVLDLLNNPETIKKAVEGSMDKRIAVLYPKKNTPVAPQRDMGDVLSDIRIQETERDAELRFCQDPDESLKIIKRYGLEISKLWAEYQSLKES